MRYLVALACLAAAACSDGSPTSPLRPGALNVDRLDPTYQWVTINVPGASSTSVQGINAGGEISGTFTDAKGHSHGFILQDGVFTTIDHPRADNPALNADNTQVRGIGPDGDVVGNYWNDSEEPLARHGFRRAADGTFTSVHDPEHLYEIPQRILPDGAVLGCRHDHDFMGSMKGILIDRSGVSEIDQFASMSNGATPDRRLIVGFYTDTSTVPARGEGYVVENGVFKPFEVPGSLSTAAWDVNSRGDIVGQYADKTGTHGFVRPGDGDTYVTLTVPGSTRTQAVGINDRGDVVGGYVSGGKAQGFVAIRQ